MRTYDILPIKTTIAFANTVNFAFLTTKRHGAEVSNVMSRPLTSDRVKATVLYSRTKVDSQNLITEASQLDAELEGWLREAYADTIRS